MAPVLRDVLVAWRFSRLYIVFFFFLFLSFFLIFSLHRPTSPPPAKERERKREKSSKVISFEESWIIGTSTALNHRYRYSRRSSQRTYIRVGLLRVIRSKLLPNSEGNFYRNSLLFSFLLSFSLPLFVPFSLCRSLIALLYFVNSVKT